MGPCVRRDHNCYAVSSNLTPHKSNPSPDNGQPFALAASRTLAISATLNVSPLIKSLAPLTKRKLAFGSFSSGSPPLPLLTAIPVILPQCSANPCGSGLCISTSVSACVTSLRIDFCQSGPAGG